jgi:hypothetical protein
MHRLSCLALALLTSCRPAPDPVDVAKAAVLAVEKATGPIAADSPRGSWTVTVAGDSVEQAPVVAESLRVYLHVRGAKDADSIRHSLTLYSARANANTLQLRFDVATTQRCGLTWAAWFGFSGEYLAIATHRTGGWQVDSVRPLIYGDPSVCSSLLVRPPPNGR